MGKTNVDGKPRKFSTSMITSLIDAGRISIEKVMKHALYLQASVSCLFTSLSMLAWERVGYRIAMSLLVRS